MADLKSLIDAIVRGDLALVTTLLAADPGLAQRSDASGATALHHAAFAGQYDAVDALLAAGADLNARDGTYGATPGGWALHRLRERGALLAVEIEDVQFALERGDEVWVRRLVRRHPALKAAYDREGRSLAAHPRVRATPSLAALFAASTMVSLRPLEPRDAPAVFHAVDSSRDALRRWMVWYRDDYALADAEAWIRVTLASAAAGTGFHFAMIDADDDLVGVISVEEVSRESGRGMLGYWMATHATGRGLGRQAVEQVVAWAREHGAIATLWAIVADANIASRRVLELNGFRTAETRGRDERGDVQMIYELALRPSPRPNEQ